MLIGDNMDELRNKVLNFLEKQKDFVSYERICDEVGITTTEEKNDLNTLLEQLKDECKLFISKRKMYQLYETSKNLVCGRLTINKKGDGFINLEGRPDVKVPKEELRYALEGDIVAGEIVEFDKDDKKYRSKDPDQIYARVIQVIKRDLDNVVGEIVKGKDGLEFKQFDKKDATFILDEDELEECVEGEVVVIKKVEELSGNRFLSTIKTRLGHKDDPGMDIKVICAKHEVFFDFPEEVLKELEDIPTEVLDKDRIGREDLTDKLIFTIDGKDTKDIDDAISIEMTEDGKYYELGVHIADVSYYVKEGSALDKEAYKRGTSCYPPGVVIPMLPHKLSNGICSLNEGVDRCAFTCQMKIDRNGQIKDMEFFKSIIRSKKKMNYDDVNAVIERDEVPEGYEDFVDSLKLLQELAHIIRNTREARGATDFDTVEPKIICDEDGTPIEIVARERGEGEKLIEDDMLSANECAAKTQFFNRALGRPSLGVYRVHEFPLPTKIEGFMKTLSTLGHPVKGDIKHITYRTVSDILKQINFKDEFEKRVIMSAAVRTMQRAYYSDQELGHYGLALKYYAHFTSPIRRYPDLKTHRIITDLALNPNVDDKKYDEIARDLAEVCNHCSDRERKADEAERECDSMKMAEYMINHVGEEFNATVNGVKPFGIFVQLDNMVEGMIPLTSLEGYYSYDESTETLTCKGKEPIMLGKEFRVKCVSASKEAEEVTFEMVKTLDKENKHNEGKKLVKEYGRTFK